MSGPVKRLSIDTPISLPADAPLDCPHIIDFQRVRNHINNLGGDHIGLRAVDAIATTLYKWDPAALQDLLDLTKDSFHWKYHNSSNYEIYVIRTGKNVKVGSQDLNPAMHYPDFEVRYKIEENGGWTIIGGSEWFGFHRVLNVAQKDDKQSCSDYDVMFAACLITNDMWKINGEKEKITCNGKIFTFVRSEEHTEETSGATEEK